MSAIRDMYEKRRGNYESIPLNSEYEKLSREYDKIEEEFLGRFGNIPDLTKSYNKAIDAFMDMEIEYANCHYLEGFRFGVLMGLEIAGMK